MMTVSLLPGVAAANGTRGGSDAATKRCHPISARLRLGPVRDRRCRQACHRPPVRSRTVRPQRHTEDLVSAPQQVRLPGVFAGTRSRLSHPRLHPWCSGANPCARSLELLQVIADGPHRRCKPDGFAAYSPGLQVPLWSRRSRNRFASRPRTLELDCERGSLNERLGR